MPTITRPGVIHSTTEYENFRILHANRNLQRPHIENIKKSIEKNGNFTEFSPIIVNDRLEIIDGQHRFTALKELGLPVYYVVTPGSGVSQAREMNKLNKGWAMLDWAKTYANTGNNSYKNFMKLVEEFGEDLSPTVVLQCAIGEYRPGMYADFREEGLSLGEGELPLARERATALIEAREANPVVGHGTMAGAYLQAFGTEGFNQQRMVSKLREYPLVSKYEKKSDNLRHLEEIYNYRFNAGNRLRFF